MSLTKEQMDTLYRNLVRANEYDQAMYKRMMAGTLIGFYHPGAGAIAPGVASHTFLNKDDFSVPHLRAHGMPGMLSKGMDLKSYLAEHTGKEGGCCAGRSSFHGCYPEYHMFGSSGFIGFQYGPSVGWGWAAKRNGRKQVVMLCGGDGSYGQGRSHEAMLMAANWKLPTIFWCENNGMAIHTPVSESHPTEDISSLAQGYGIPAMVVDGQDVFACAEAAQAAIAHARKGKGPTFVEAKTLRFTEHDIGTPDLVGSTPRTEEYHAEIRKRDPIVLATERVLADGVLTQNEIDSMGDEAVAEVEAAWLWADEQPKAMPSEEELLNAVYAP